MVYYQKNIKKQCGGAFRAGDPLYEPIFRLHQRGGFDPAADCGAGKGIPYLLRGDPEGSS